MNTRTAISLCLLLALLSGCDARAKPPGYDYVADLCEAVHDVQQVSNNLHDQSVCSTVTSGGDCLDKAYLLWHLMDASGLDADIMVGRVDWSDENHAWLEWEAGGETYILDPTVRRGPVLRARARGYEA